MMNRLGQWITDWPWTKTFTMLGVTAFALALLVAGLAGVTMWLIPALQPSTPAQLELVREARNWFNDALQWAVLAATGGLLGNGLVRATTKPDVIRAQAEAEAMKQRAAPMTLVADIAPVAPRDAMSEDGP